MDAPRDVFKPLAALVFTEIDKGHVTFKGPFCRDILRGRIGPSLMGRRTVPVAHCAAAAASCSGVTHRNARHMAPKAMTYQRTRFAMWAAHFSNELPRGAKFPMELRRVELVGLRH